MQFSFDFNQQPTDVVLCFAVQCAGMEYVLLCCVVVWRNGVRVLALWLHVFVVVGSARLVEYT